MASSTNAYYNDEGVTISCSSDLSNLTIIITVQKTVGATYHGAYSTFGSGLMNVAYVDTGTEIIYSWTIVSGNTIPAYNSPYRAVAQFNLYGTIQITSADTYEIRATTTSVVTSTVSGHF